MIITPAKPMMVAIQRRRSTFSFSTSTAAMVTKKTWLKPIAVACASGIWMTAEKPHSIEASVIRPRVIWSPGRVVRISSGSAEPAIATMTRLMMIWRIIRISISGIAVPTCFIAPTMTA